MSELLVRPEKFRDRIETFGYEYLSFEARKLTAGGQYAAETGVNELAIVVLGGVCSVSTTLENWSRIGGRSSVFDGLPYTLYLPVAPHSPSRPTPIATWPSAIAAPKSIIRPAW